MPADLRRLIPLLAAIAALLVTFRLSFVNFLSTSNLLDLAQQISVNAILAFGMTLVILIGGIDLSVGALVALVGTTTVYAIRPDGWNAGTPAAMLAGVAVALVFGAFHGVAAARSPMPPFIITLGTMLVARGLALRFNEGRPTNLPSTEKFYIALSSGRLGDLVPVPALIMTVLYVLMATILQFTVFGRHLYAIGGNKKAALYSGIAVARHEIAVYLIASVLVAFAGFIHSSQVQGAEPASGVGFELDAIAAAVVGGASLQGGRGTMTGTLLGAVIIGILNKGLNQTQVHYSWQSMIKGLVILGAVWLDVRRKRPKS
jgi:ribose transport system permease protein